MTLTAQQLRHLRGLTHQLHPVVTVADKGLTENVVAELDAAFSKHELIKVKLRAEKATRETWIEEITHKCTAQKVHVIGQIACFFKRNHKKPVISLPQ